MWISPRRASGSQSRPCSSTRRGGTLSLEQVSPLWLARLLPACPDTWKEKLRLHLHLPCIRLPEYRNKTLTNLAGGNPRLGCYGLAVTIFALGILRDHLCAACCRTDPCLGDPAETPRSLAADTTSRWMISLYRLPCWLLASSPSRTPSLPSAVRSLSHPCGHSVSLVPT